MNINIITIIIYTAAAVEVLLGGIVFFSDKNNKINRFFAIVAIITAYWIVTNPLMALEPKDVWVKNSYAVGILVAPVILVWITMFITKKTVSIGKIFSILGSAFLFFIITIFSNLIIKTVDINYVGGFIGSFGSLFPLFTIYFIVVSSYILFLITRAYLKSSGVEKTQYGYIAFGLYGFGVVTAIVSFILPIIGIVSLTPLDSTSSIFLIVAMSYAVIKHHLFNIKVIATELITFVLWIFILIRGLLAQDTQGMLIEGGLLLITIVVGILLIKSVIKEVSQREKIEKLAGELQKANERLTELDKQKSEFVSFATHQLRAPLTAMKGYSSLILEGNMGKISNEIRIAIGRIFESSDTLTHIVDDYLNISRIELGSMHYSFENIDLTGLVDSAVGELRPNIEKSGLKFAFEVDRSKKYMVNVDKDKFQQIVINLVDNAMKYTPSGTITASIFKKAEASGHKVVFSVKDSGIGIAPEVLPKLFSKFTRAENGNKQNIHGTGLGLYVAKEIVVAHKGNIWAESLGEGKGSTFFVELEEGN